MEENAARERIREAAMERFLQFGFSSVTVDEIAAELGISKRTLYQHFPAKKDLLREGLEARVERISLGLSKVVERDEPDYVDKLAAAMRFMVENLPRPSRRFFQDMPRSAPEVWATVESKRAEAIREHFGRLFREGVRRGALRPDLSPEFLLQVFLTLVHDLIRPETLAQMPMSLAQAFDKLSSILLVGVLTESASREYREKSGEEAK